VAGKVLKDFFATSKKGAVEANNKRIKSVQNSWLRVNAPCNLLVYMGITDLGAYKGRRQRLRYRKHADFNKS
jgi:hypothetical protein